jgi:hypothetical protein
MKNGQQPVAYFLNGVQVRRLRRIPEQESATSVHGRLNRGLSLTVLQRNDPNHATSQPNSGDWRRSMYGKRTSGILSSTSTERGPGNRPSRGASEYTIQLVMSSPVILRD